MTELPSAAVGPNVRWRWDRGLVARAVSINGDGQADKVSAADENGVLSVTRPKREEARPEKITSAVK